MDRLWQDLIMKEFDVIIAGGGMVGATAALALAKIDQQPPLKIALVESVKADSNVSPSFDERAVALSAASVEIYKSLGLWEALRNIAEPITDIHISEQNHFGFTRLAAKDYKLDALGQVIPLSETGPLLWNEIKKLKNIMSFCPNKIININSKDEQQKSNHVTVELETSLNDDNKNITAKLLIAADGTFSNLAQMAGIETERQNYNQHAIIANISTEKPHNNKAFERFTQEGPLALLPLTRSRMSLVWCQTEEHLNKTMTLGDEDFIKELQSNFGFRLGKITKVGKRSSYPLSLHLPNKCFKNRTLLLGNSAHTLHPIAGQGFNIGLRDIAALVDSIRDCLSSNKNLDFGNNKFLEKYESQRQPDWQKTIGTTDSLVRLFSNNFLPLNSVRSKALWLIDKVPILKNKIANGAMGFAGESARLTRGIK